MRGKRESLKLEISRIEPLGNFSPDDLRYIEKEGNGSFSSISPKRGQLMKKNLPEDLVYLGNAHHLDYFMGIRKEPAQYNKMVENQN